MDTIVIYDTNHQPITMEVVLTYRYQKQDYIIYRSMDQQDYFIAKYDVKGTFMTDLTEEEITYGNQVLGGSVE